MQGGADLRPVATMLALAAAGAWLLILRRRRRTGRGLSLMGSGWPAAFGAAGLAAFAFSLSFLDRVPLGHGAAALCGGAALTALAARLVLREPVARMAWPAAILVAVGLAMVGVPALPLALGGIGWGVHALLMRRGDPLNAAVRHLIGAALLLLPCLLTGPALRGEALILTLCAAACLLLTVTMWHRVRVPALGFVAGLTGAAALAFGQPPALALLLTALGAFALQRTIGSNGS